MATANFGEGAVFEISDDMISKMVSFDRYLERIAKSSAKINATPFQSLITALNGLKVDNVASLERLAAAMDKLSGATGASNGISTLAKGLNDVGSNAQKAVSQIGTINTSLSQTAQLLNQISVSKRGGTSTGSLGLINISGLRAEQEQLLSQMRGLRERLMSVFSTNKPLIASIMGDSNSTIANIKAQIEQLGKSVHSISAKNPSNAESLIRPYIDAIHRLQNEISSQKSLGNNMTAPLRKEIAAIKKEYESLLNSITSVNSRISSAVEHNDTIAKQALKVAELKKQLQGVSAEFEILKATGQAYNASGGLSSQSQSLIAKKKALEEEIRLQGQSLDTAQKNEDKKAQAAQKAADKAAAAAQKAAEQQQRASERAAAQAERDAERKAAAERKAYAETTKQQQQQNYKKNTTYQGALDFSSTANTIQRQITAIEYLKKARMSLDPTKDKAKIDELNNAIQRHNQNLQQAGVQSSNLAAKHRNLMDISGQLARQFALLFSVSQVEGYISQIAKVRGEFELQQRSLEAILQNKTQADAIFQKTVDLALKSPFQIKELVSYTKQLAAYRIEGDKLYDTTKRLADVSAGLGVDMQRLILAYGQVKAAAYLRGCLGYDTEIVMYDGSKKKVQDVIVGDLLRGDDDEPRTVKELIRGEEQMYEVSGDGYSYRVNQNHILTLFSVSQTKVVDVYVEDFLANKQDYLGVRYEKGKFTTYPISIRKDKVDDYFGFVIDQDKRFLIGDNVVTHNTEVRQFTEAGVNMYGELQSYFQEVKGEAYTTAQIVDMISKRKVTFEDVEAVFQRLTSQGGLFYNMQEIQSETLNGKIANLKDSIDVMMNEIGMANEGLLKGGVDAIKTLLDNWRSVLNVAKTFGIVLAAMGLTAWNAKIKAANSGLGLFAVGCKNASGALKAFGNIFKASLPTMAIFAAISIISELIGKVREYNKAIAESTNKYFEAKIRISAMKDESEKDIKKALDQLVKEMNNEGYEIKIKTGISEEEAKKEFDTYLEEYDKFLNEQRVIEAKYARNKNQWVVDDIDEDNADYSSSVSEFIAQGDELKTILMQLSEEENNLSEKHKEVLAGLAKGPKDGEGILAYTNRMKEEIGKMWPQLNAALDSMRSGNGMYTQEAMNARANLTKLFELSKGYLDDEKEMVKELEDVYGSVDKYKSKAEKQRLKILIDKSELDTVTKELAYKHYGLNVKINKENIKEQALTFKDQLQAELDKNKLTVKVDMITDGQGVIDYWMNGQEQMQKTANILKKQLDYVKANPNQYYLGGELQKRGFDLKGLKTKSGKAATQNTYIGSSYVQKEIEKRLAALHQEGIDPKEEAKRKTDAEKAERDIWNERISVLKEMQQQYEKVREHYGEDTAKAMTLSEYMPTLTDVNIGAVIKPEDIVPTKQGIVDALEKALSAMPKTLKDYKKKSIDLQKTIHNLKLEIETEEAQKKLEETKKYVEHLFDGLDLHQKLKDVGLSEAEVQALFPGLAKTLDDVELGIHNKYNGLRDKDGNLGTDEQKAYDEEIKNLNQKRIKEQQDLVVELTKAYKTQLSDQLQLDNWYYKEKYKIAQMNADAIARINADTSLTSEQKASAIENVGMQTSGYKENLQSQYGKKSNDNAWNAFKESDSYLMLFSGDMGQMTTKTLEMLRSELDNLKASMQNLDPAHLKEVMDIYNKIDDAITGNNPFAALVKDLQKIKALKAEGWTEEALINEITNNDRDIASLEAEQEQINKVITLNELKAEGKTLDEQDARFLQQNSQLAGLSIPELQQELKANKAIVKEIKEKNATAKEGQLTYTKTKSDTQAVANEWQQLLSVTQGAWSSIKDVLAACGDEGDSTTEMIIDIILQLAQAAVQAILFGAAMKSAMGPIGWIMIAIEAIAGIMATILGNSDKSKQEEIENLQRKVEALENAYDDLSDAMDEAWNFAELEQYNEQMEANLKLQNQYLRSMIAAEKDKKDSDQDQIDDWTEQINDNLKAIEENAENALEAAGGLGSKSNWKDAAQDFADAWVDAFNEGEDALDALNESFDELITNMIKKQAMNRVVSSMLEPIFTLIDEAVDPEGKGGYKVLKEELDAIKTKWAATAPELNEALTSLMDILDYTPTNSTELSALQQGITSITEEQASAIEALLNSLRFFVATEQSDVSAIRSILEMHFSTSIASTSSTQEETQVSTSSPLLSELKAQTVLISGINTLLESVCCYNNNSSGRGIRVYMK